MKQVLHNMTDMQNFASSFLNGLQKNMNGATVVGLYGDLGSGKTTFTQTCARILHIEDTLQSPTFVIMKKYNIEHVDYKTCIHIDAYRLEKSSELQQLGWQELIHNSDNLIFIEWPEKVLDIMPKHIKIEFKHISENEREVQVINP